MPRYQSETLPESIRKCLPKEEKQKLGKAGLTMAEITAKADRTEESDMHRQFSDWLRLHSIEFGHARFDKKSHYTLGWPDYTLAVKGSTGFLNPIGIEFKTALGVLSDDQLKCIARMQDNGWKVRVARSVEEAIRFVKELMR